VSSFDFPRGGYFEPLSGSAMGFDLGQFPSPVSHQNPKSRILACVTSLKGSLPAGKDDEHVVAFHLWVSLDGTLL
jgi:hypothetical protein